MKEEANEKRKSENNLQCVFGAVAWLCHKFAQDHIFLPTVCGTAHICTQPDVLTHRLCYSTHLHTARCSYPPFVLQHTSAHSQMFLSTVCVKHTSAHSQMFLRTVCVTAHICTQPDVLTHPLCYSTHLHTARCSYPGLSVARPRNNWNPIYTPDCN